MDPIKTLVAIAVAAAATWATAGQAANNRLPVSVLSSGPYEIVTNETSAWILDTSTGRFKVCEKPKNIKDKPSCSAVQNFD